MKRIPIVIAICIFFLLSVSNATINYAAIVNQTGSVKQVLYDNRTNAYDDAGTNPNSYLKLCTNNLSELTGMYVGYAYFAGPTYVQLNSFIGGPLGLLLPVLYTDISNCTMVDLDFSSTKAYYPGVPAVIISNDSLIDTSDKFIQLNKSTAFLNGSYNVQRNDAVKSISVKILSIKSEKGISIITIKPAIVVALLREDTLGLLDSKIMMPNETVALSNGGFKNTVVEVNGLLYYGPAAKEEGLEGAGLAEASCDPTLEVSRIATINDGERKDLGEKYCTELHLKELVVKLKMTSLVISIKKISEKPADIIVPENVPYLYFDVTAENVTSGSVDEVTFTYRVSKNWITENNIYEKKVALYAYKDGAWQELESTLAWSDGAFYYYQAKSTGFSYYAIVGNEITIWDVTEIIDEYYNHEASFLDVLDAISKYYSK